MTIDRHAFEHINWALVDSGKASIEIFRTTTTQLLSDNSVVSAHFDTWEQSGYDPAVLMTGVKQQLVDRFHRGVTPPMSNLTKGDNLDVVLAAELDGSYLKQLNLLKEVQRHIQWCDSFAEIVEQVAVTT